MGLLLVWLLHIWLVLLVGMLVVWWVGGSVSLFVSHIVVVEYDYILCTLWFNVRCCAPTYLGRGDCASSFFFARLLKNHGPANGAFLLLLEGGVLGNHAPTNGFNNML